MSPLATRAIDPESKEHARRYRLAVEDGDEGVARSHALALAPVATAADPEVHVDAGDGRHVVVRHVANGPNTVDLAPTD